MKEFNSDLIIVGGGLTGLLSAYVLSQLNVQICLVDAGKIFSNKKKITDYRTTAISEGSKAFFQEVKIWEKLKKHSERIKYISVLDRKKSSKIKFITPSNVSNLGYVIKNSIIKDEIIKLIKKKKNINILENTSLKKIIISDNGVKAILSKEIINSKLLLSADGKKSFVRKLMKTGEYSKKYNHSAIVANFSHEKNHNNIAHEIFLESGPLAILPMQSSSKKLFNTSMIWSNTKNFSENIIKIDPRLRKKIIEEKVVNYTGDIIKIFETKIFDLSAHINFKFYENRVVYVGDSAHSLHPIAGQGWNLGVRDIKNLYKVLIKSKKLGLDIGSEFVCKQYHDMSYYDAYSLYQITDKLNSLFLDQKKISTLIRKIGFKLIDNNQTIKQHLSNYAMGFKI